MLDGHVLLLLRSDVVGNRKKKKNLDEKEMLFNFLSRHLAFLSSRWVGVTRRRCDVV